MQNGDQASPSINPAGARSFSELNCMLYFDKILHTCDLYILTLSRHWYANKDGEEAGRGQ